MGSSTPDERAQRHERLMDDVRLSAKEGNREHQLLLLLWESVFGKPIFHSRMWLLHAFEWEVEQGQPHLGRGDAVLVAQHWHASSGGLALVLELKALHEVITHYKQAHQSSAAKHA